MVVLKMNNINQRELALVTVLYHSNDVLDDFFESLAKQKKCEYKIFIVDNSETDSSRAICYSYIEKYNINAEYIFNNENVGVAKGNNIGIRLGLSQGFKKILLLNNDITFEGDLFSELLSQSTRYTEKIFIPKIYYHGTNMLWMAGGHYDKWTSLTPHRGDGEDDNGQYDQSDIINYAPTCFMLIDSSIFDAIGFMDEKYFVYYDDTDFIFRCVQFNNLIRYLPSLKVNHKVSALTGGNTSLFSIYYANRNRLYFILKNLSGFRKVINLSYYFLTRIIYFLISKKDVRAKVKSAIYDGLKM
jgi:GT2 family glycosyltransferase